MPTRAVVAATLAAVIGSTLAATQSVPPLDRLIQTNIVLQVPVPPCVAPHLVRRLSREVGVPAGVEFLPESCGTSTADGDPGDDVPLIGLSLAEALDRIVAADPRYAWRDSDGVVVLRPLDAWANRDHYLHRTIPAFGFSDRAYQWALREVLIGLGKPASFADFPGRTAGGVRTFSVAPDSRSAIEALDAVVRAHGALDWVVRYCEPRMDANATWLGRFTHDGDGGMTTVTERRDDGGRRLPHCQLGQ